MYRVNSRLTGYGLGIEDVVQEVFEKVWRSGHKSFRPDKRTSGACPLASTRSWLTTITLRIVQNILRRRSKYDPVDPFDNEDLFVEPPKDKRIQNAIGVQQLVQNALSETDAAVVWFKMQYYDPETGESHPPREELADFLGKHELTDAAFRKRYSRAIKTLQAAETPTPLTAR
jgi:DNA-directed RNA polymerase specialized sigma24 family protein